jgi:hypothetical protein
MRTSNLTDPDFEPTDEQLDQISRGAIRYVRFRAAMADRGIKILAMRLSLDEEDALMIAWEKEQGLLP